MTRLFLIFYCGLFLSSCGFKPLYQVPDSPTGKIFDNVQIELVMPPEPRMKESAYLIQNYLFDRMGQNSGETVLRIEPTLSRRIFGISSNDVATRYELTITVNYEILDVKTQKTVDSGRVRSVSTFGSGLDNYERVSAEKDAVDQTARDVADRLIIKLATHLQNSRNP